MKNRERQAGFVLQIDRVFFWFLGGVCVCGGGVRGMIAEQLSQGDDTSGKRLNPALVKPLRAGFITQSKIFKNLVI